VRHDRTDAYVKKIRYRRLGSRRPRYPGRRSQSLFCAAPSNAQNEHINIGTIIEKAALDYRKNASMAFDERSPFHITASGAKNLRQDRFDIGAFG
jgi:hypothetical protein